MELSEENVPPTKKLKQATLSFFKTSAPSPKLTSAPIGIKRKLPSGPDSPNKLAKLSKPLAPVAVFNTESASATSASKGKLPKPPKKSDVEENDQEVSSSSEAETLNGKANNGKCCLMERFVRKLPHDAHQEISSTNEVLDISGVDDDCARDAASESTKSEEQKSDNDCIVIEDEACDTLTVAKGKLDCDMPKDSSTVVAGKPECDAEKKDQKNLDDASKKKVDESNERTNQVQPSGDCEESVSKSDVSTAEEIVCTPQKKGPVFGGTSSKKANLDSSDVTTPVRAEPSGKKLANMDSPSVSTPVRAASIGSPASMSTPLSSVSTPPVTLDTSQSSTGETPISGVKKIRSRKVDSAKKAEKDALKLKMKEAKEKEKEEKKKKLEEEKMKKEQARKELKEAKDKEKQEQKEKAEKERLEKLKQKEEEKKKKEEERLKKEEEKKKLLDAKLEEKRKKDEEKRLKDEEKRLKEEEKLKEEEEKRKKAEKTKQAFQSFFIKNKEPEQKAVAPKNNGSIFIPFQVRKDMHLAPAVRSCLTSEKRDSLDQQLSSQQTNEDYLCDLKKGDCKPHKTGRILRKNPKPVEEVEIVHDSEALKTVFHKVKLLQFHTDHRPPYYGTWRKQADLNPRDPWYKDSATFDYEVDSEEEWEEEEPGESLSNSEGEEDKEDKGGEDEDEDGWMVPHGYLSEDEGCNEDEEITPEKLKLQQAAKAKAWEMEQQRKLQAAPVIAVGCFFEHSPSSSMTGDVRLLYEFRGVILAPAVPIPTSLSNPNPADCEESLKGTDEPCTPKVAHQNSKPVPDSAMPDLIQMLHGNTCGIKRLVREFRMFWIQKNDKPGDKSTTDKLDTSALNNSVAEADASILNESAVECSIVDEKDSPDKNSEKEGSGQQKREEGYGCSISKTQLDKKIRSMAVREKREGTIRACWYVNKEVLSQFNLTDIALPNTWAHLSAGSIAPLYPAPKSDVIEATAEEEKTKSIAKPNDQKSIIGFTLTKEELLKQEALKPKPVETIEKPKIQLKTVSDQKSITAFTKSKDDLAKQTDLKQKLSAEEEPEPTVKTPAKPKMSIMDMLLKKSASKKKIDEGKSKENDSDVEMVENPLQTNTKSSLGDVKKTTNEPEQTVSKVIGDGSACNSSVTCEVESMDVDVPRSKEKPAVNDETQMEVSVSDIISDIVSSSNEKKLASVLKLGKNPIEIEEDSNDVIILD